MNGFQCYLQAIKRYFVFKGRASTKEYWYFILFVFIASAIGGGIDMAINALTYSDIELFASINLFFSLIPFLSTTIRRLHDTNRSGWYILTGLIPLILLILLLEGGTDGSNKYGPDPKKSKIEKHISHNETSHT